MNEKIEKINENIITELQKQLENYKALNNIQEALIDNLNDAIKVRDIYIEKLNELLEEK